MVSVSLFPKQFTVGILNSFLRGVRLFPGGGVRLSRCLSSLVNLSPFICFPIWLMVSGSPDVSQFMCLPVAIHLSPSLAGGVQLFVFTCLASSPSLAGGVRLSRCLPIHLSPSASSWCPALAFVSKSGWWCPDLWMSFLCFHVSLIMCLSPRVSQFYACLLICLQASVCLSLLVVVSGSFACSLLCVFHHLSLTFCLVLHLFPESFVSNPMSALVVVSCSSFIMILFVFHFCLSSLFTFVSSCRPKIKSCSTMVLCALPRASYFVSL